MDHHRRYEMNKSSWPRSPEWHWKPPSIETYYCLQRGCPCVQVSSYVFFIFVSVGFCCQFGLKLKPSLFVILGTSPWCGRWSCHLCWWGPWLYPHALMIARMKPVSVSSNMDDIVSKNTHLAGTPKMSTFQRIFGTQLHVRRHHGCVRNLLTAKTPLADCPATRIFDRSSAARLVQKIFGLGAMLTLPISALRWCNAWWRRICCSMPKPCMNSACSGTLWMKLMPLIVSMRAIAKMTRWRSTPP